MEKNKKKYYYSNNKRYYPKKKKEENKPKMTYEKIVNIRNDVDDVNIVTITSNTTLKIAAVILVTLAIIFCSLILFHVI